MIYWSFILGEAVVPMIRESSMLGYGAYRMVTGRWISGLPSWEAALLVVLTVRGISLALHALSPESLRHWFQWKPRWRAGWAALHWREIIDSPEPFRVFWIGTISWLGVYFSWNPSGWAAFAAYFILVNIPHAVIDWNGRGLERLFQAHQKTAFYAYRDLMRRHSEILDVAVPPILAAMGFQTDFLVLLTRYGDISWDNSSRSIPQTLRMALRPNIAQSHDESNGRIQQMLFWGYMEMAWRLLISEPGDARGLHLAEQSWDAAGRMMVQEGTDATQTMKDELAQWQIYVQQTSEKFPLYPDYSRQKKLNAWVAEHWPPSTTRLHRILQPQNFKAKWWYDEFLKHRSLAFRIPAGGDYSDPTASALIDRIFQSLSGRPIAWRIGRIDSATAEKFIKRDY